MVNSALRVHKVYKEPLVFRVLRAPKVLVGVLEMLASRVSKDYAVSKVPKASKVLVVVLEMLASRASKA